VMLLRSTEELRLLIDLYLRGWNAQEIQGELDRTRVQPFDSLTSCFSGDQRSTERPRFGAFEA